MNCKRYIVTCLVVFVAMIALDFVIHGMLLRGDYEATKAVWRPDMQSKVWIFWLIDFIIAFPFTYIFVKGREGKGIMEGVRFGAVIGVFACVPMAYGMYAMLPVPYVLAFRWLLYGYAQMIVLGAAAAAVYRPKAG